MHERKKRNMIKEPKETQKNELKNERTGRGVRARREWRFSLETPRYSKPSTPGRRKLLMGGLS